MTNYEEWTPRDKILGYMEDMISDFLYYDRKEDEDMPRDYIEDAIKRGDLTIEEIVAEFDKQLRKGLSAS